MVEIRRELPQDIPLIREVNKQAFGQSLEGEIVDKLRLSCNDLLSLVAVVNDQVVGHILFSSAAIDGTNKTIDGMGLAPMAVLPEHQRQGIGSALIREGISILENGRCPFIIVLGHPEYYPRFGFKPASCFGIRCQWEVPDDAFMILVLNESEVQGISGIAKYRPEFDLAM